MYMTPEASGFYLSRILPFLTIAQVAKKCYVTRPTVERWVEQRLVPVKYQSALENLLDDLVVQFRNESKKYPQPNLYNKLEQAMLDTEPKVVAGIDPDERISEFIAEIRPLLKKGLASKEVFRIGTNHNLPRQRVYRITDKMGVTRDVKGRGRNMKSTWYL